jgi:predicted metal-dependent peptidase
MTEVANAEPPKGIPQTRKLTADEHRQWDEVMTMLQWKAPGFKHIAYKLLTNNNGQYVAVMTDRCPIAATDGKNILINPDTFFSNKYTLPNRVFAVCHEIGHNVLDDVNTFHRFRQTGKVPMPDGTTLPYNEDALQRSADYRLNALLDDSQFGKCHEEWLLDRELGTADESLIEVYKKVYEQMDANGELGGPGTGDVLVPGVSTGQDPGTAAASRNPAQWATEMAVARQLEKLRTQGKMPGALERLFSSLLEPEVYWVDKIKTIVDKRVGSGTYNWRRADRRFIIRDIYLPSRSGYGCGWIVMWGDTSGSRGDDEIASHMAETKGIIEDCKPRRVTIVWCDADVQNVDELEDVQDIMNVKPKGGGGTEVQPVFDWINKSKEDPDMFIGFTDGYVTFPAAAPKYPVIWASSTKGQVQYPWGDVVEINQRPLKP